MNLTDKSEGYSDNIREDMFKYIPCDVKKTLEFGCGTGGFSALVKKEFNAESWAVEIDEKSAKAASQKLDIVINSDANEAVDRLPDHFFDCIIFFDVLEHLVDPYALLWDIKAKLTNHGIVLASIPNVRYYRTFSDLVIHGNWDYKDHGVLDKTHLRFFTMKSIVKMFGKLEFEIIKLEGIHPTSSRTFKLINTMLLNLLYDVKYKHFVVLAKPM